MNRKSLFAAGIWIFLALPLGWCQAPSKPAPSKKYSLFDRNVLWEIVDHCLERSDPASYCKTCPSPLLPFLAECNDISDWYPDTICRKTTQVWNKTADFVAIRDYKECGCPKDFVHGLAIPRREVTGAEDPRRPVGIWKFAWEEAVKKIPAKETIMLGVNPKIFRTQDQLHIHLVRLSKGSRQKLSDMHPIRIKDINETWGAAQIHAAPSELEEGLHGIAVLYDAKTDEFLVVTTTDRLERQYSVYACKDSK